jgi:hypothetical protein
MEIPMLFRRSAAVVVAAAVLVSAGCAKLDDRGKPQNLTVAVFDPSKSLIPLPNDLALGSIKDAAVAAGCAPSSDPDANVPDAKSQFLCALKRSGGFPNDQEVSITFAFQRQSVNEGGVVLADPALVDTTTVRVLGAVPPAQATVAVFDVTNAPTVVPVVVEASYASGTLKLRKPAAADGSRRWTGAHKYAVFVRGGANGVKAVGGAEIEPMPTMFVLREAILSGRSLTDPDNQTLLPGTAEQKAAAGAQLEPIRQGYAQLRPVFEGTFGPGSFATMVNMLTFTVAPSQGVVVEVDSTKGSAPLPVDLLRAPDAAGGLVLSNAAFGSAAPGLAFLDGFSTTGSITAPLTGGHAAVDASTVNGANVFLFELGGVTTIVRELRNEGARALQGDPTANPAAAGYVAQPDGSFLPSTACGVAGGCASSIVLQPAVPTPTGVYLPPLKEGTKYAVVITKRVKEVTGAPLGRSTAARILLELTHPVDSSIGVDAGTAALLEQMRTDLAPVWTRLPVGTAKSDVAMAYVFRTQSISSQSLQLSGAPHAIEQKLGAAVFVPALATSVTSSFPKVAGAAAIYSVAFPSLDATSKTTGALDPVILSTLAPASTIQAAIKPLRAFVAFPAGFTGNRPLVLFGHGLGGSRYDAFESPGASPAANALLAKGFVVAAVDFPQHGDRTWCRFDSDCGTGPKGTGGGGTCTAFAGSAGQGDTDGCGGAALEPGVCTSNSAPDIANRSGQTFIGANFFRTRDAFRQNLIDQAALALSLARPSWAPGVGTASHADALAAALLADGISISPDPNAIYWEGISLGGIAGTDVLATNFRVSRGVTSVAGGALFDVFTKAPAFQARVLPLFSCLLKRELDSIGAGSFTANLITPTDPSFSSTVASAYGKTAIVAKWILDPGDPLNYARHLKVAPLPNIVLGGTQAAKSVLGQVAVGDLVVQNPFNLELFRNGQVDTITYTSGVYPAADIHGLLSFDPTVQGHAADYLDNPGATLPASPFAVP